MCQGSTDISVGRISDPGRVRSVSAGSGLLRSREEPTKGLGGVWSGPGREKMGCPSGDNVIRALWFVSSAWNRWSESGSGWVKSWFTITIVLFRVNVDNDDYGDGSDSDLGLNELYIDESPQPFGSTTASVVVEDAGGSINEYEAVSRRTRSRNRVRSTANTPPESDEEEEEVRPRGRKRRSTSRTVVGADGGAVVAPSGGRAKRRSSDRDPPAKKRSRPQSRDRQQGLSTLPSPPMRKNDKHEDDKVLDGYIKSIAKLHRENLVQQAHHGCFGQKGESTLRGIHAVARGGKLPTSCLPRGYHRRWGTKYPPGYFDSDPEYYSDPEKLNPPKDPAEPAARAAVSDSEHQAGPSGLQSQSLSQAPPTLVAPFRAVTKSAGSAGALEVTVHTSAGVTGGDDGVVDADALEIHADETDLLSSPILRKTRSFEEKNSGKSVRINLGGVRFYVLKGDSRGVREDRRGPYTIDHREKQARTAHEREQMSDQEEMDSLNAEQDRKDAKFERKRARWATLNEERMEYITANNIYCNPNGDDNTTGEGVDAFVGNQEWQIEGCAEIIAREIVTNASLVTKRPATWRATVDSVAAIEETFAGHFSNEKPGIDPSIDLSLVRAREMRRLNGLWTYVFTKAIVEAEKQANERLVIDKELVSKWLKDRDQEAAASAVVAAVEPSETEIVEISDDESDASSVGSSGDTDSVSSGFNTDTAEEIYARAVDDRNEIIVVDSPDAGEADDGPSAGAGVHDDSVPWEDFRLDNANDVLADADAAGLTILNQNKLAFLANLNHRLAEYEESGFVDDYLFRQLTMG